MPTQKRANAPIGQIICLFLLLFQLPTAAPLQAQAFEESYFSARYPKRTGTVKGFIKSRQSLLLHATAPHHSPFPSEYLAAINPEGQTLWSSFNWPQNVSSAVFSNLTTGANNFLYLISTEDGIQHLIKVNAATGALLWKKPFASGQYASRIVERNANELALLEYDGANWLRCYNTADGEKTKEVSLPGFPGFLAADVQGDLYYSRADSVFKLNGSNPNQYLWRSSAELPLNIWTENWTQAYLSADGTTLTILGKNSGDFGIYAHLNTLDGQLNETHQNFTYENLRDRVAVGDTLYSCWQHAYVGGGNYSFSLLASRISNGSFAYQQLHNLTNPSNGQPLFGASGSLSLDADDDGYLYIAGYSNTANYDPGVWGIMKVNRADGAKVWDKIVDDTPPGFDFLSTGRLVWIPENGKLWVAGEIQVDGNAARPILTELDKNTGARLQTVDLAGNYQFPSATMQFLTDANGFTTLKQTDNRVQVARFDQNGQPQWETDLALDAILEANGMYAGKGNAIWVPAKHHFIPYFSQYEFRFDSLYLYRLNAANGQVLQTLRFAGQGQLTNPLFVSAQTDTVMLVYHEYDNVKMVRWVGQQQMPPVVLRSGVWDPGAFLAPRHLFVEQGRRLIYVQSLNQYHVCTPNSNVAYNIPPVPVFMNAATALTGTQEIVAGGTQNNNSGWGIFRWLPGSDVAAWSKIGTIGTIDRVISTTDQFLYTSGVKNGLLYCKKMNAATGAVVWEKTITPSADQPEINTLSWNAAAGELVLGGALVKANGQRRVWLIKLDGNGNILVQMERAGDASGAENRLLSTGVMGGKVCLGGQMHRAGLGRAGFIWLQEGNFYTASGKVYYDQNNNLQPEPAEPVWRQPVSLSPGNYLSFPDSTGVYQFFVPQAGNYQAGVAPFSPHIAVDPADFTLNNAQSSLTGQHIRLWPTVQVQDASVELLEAQPLRFGSASGMVVSVHNLGTLMVDSSRLLVDCGNAFTFNGLSPATGQTDSLLTLHQTGSTLEGTISGLELLQRQDWEIQGQLNSFLLPGDTLHCKASISTFPPLEVFLQNNADTLDRLVTGAYDPNDIAVTPGPLVNLSRLLPDGSLDLLYRIRFENTGNAPTDFIRVETVLHPLLKPETLQLGAASAPCTMQFMEDRRVAFVFPEYHLLPVMADSQAAQGYVFFRIKTESGLDIGDQCLQEAAIYFDYNPPIQTNQASLTITSPSAVYSPEKILLNTLEIYPNPVQAGQTVWLKNEDMAQPVSFRLSDLAGRVVLQGFTGNGIPLRGVPAGWYILESGKKRTRLVVVNPP